MIQFFTLQKFIEPFLFGRKKKQNVQDRVTELNKTVQSSMKEMKDSILKMEGDVQKLTEHQALDPTIPQLVQELKQDLSSLKALLLSRYIINFIFLCIIIFCINMFVITICIKNQRFCCIFKKFMYYNVMLHSNCRSIVLF